ncbi:MAG: hypothetical protein V4646_12500 [Pseudomonadota bacterium]
MKRSWITRKTIPDEYSGHANWPEVSTASWSESDISRFNRLRAALEAYLNGERVAHIRARHNASSSALVYYLNRCLTASNDGRIKGWRGLIKNARIKDYTRVTEEDTWTGKGGLSGSFIKLLLDYPPIAEGLKDFILKSPKKRDRIVESGIAFQGIYQKFQDLCIEAGRLPGQYPFNTESRGSASVRRFAHQIRKERFESGARLLGGDVGASRTAPGTGLVSILTAEKPYDTFQLDEHKMDFVGVVLIQTPKGPQLIPISRLVLILVAEVNVQCVVGYHIAIRSEASAEEMVLAMSNVLGRWRPRQLVIDYVRYMPGAGLPSGVIPELDGACAAEMQIDNSMAHWSRAFVDRIRQRTGMSINWGPIGHWVRRQVVERVFGILEKRGFQRLISTTGSHPRDVRKSDPVGAAIRHEIELEEILDLVDVVIANFNAKPTSALGGRSPLDMLRHYVSMNAFGFLPRRLPALPSHVPDMTMLVVKVKIRGSQGVHATRQYVEKFYARYTSPMLASTASLIGHEVTLHINTQDPRNVQAFFKDGGSLGMLTAMGIWGIKPHTLEMRKEIGRLIYEGKLEVLTGEDEITAFNRHMFDKGQKKRDQNKGRPTISKEATKAAHYATATGSAPKAGVPMPMPPRKPVPPPPAPALKQSGSQVAIPTKPPEWPSFLPPPKFRGKPR